jgi:O-antigen/teichoic acid export membrane protein
MRRTAKSIGFLLLSHGVTVVGGVVILAFTARYLGPTRFGQQAVLRAIAYALFPLLVGGMRVHMVKEIGANPEGAASYVGNVLTLRWAMTIVIAAASVAIVRALPLSRELEIASYAVILLVLAGVWETIARGIFTAYERNEYNLALSTATGVLTIPATLLAIHLDTGVAGILAAAAVVTWVTAQAACLVAWRRFVRPKLGVDLQRWREILVESFPIGLGALLRRSYARIDVWLLAALRGSEAAGIFSLAYRVAVQTASAAVTVGTAILPRLSLLASTARDQLRRAFECLLVIFLAVSIPGAGVVAAWAGPLVFLLVGREFVASVEPLRLVAITIITALPDTLLFFCLVALGKEKVATLCVAVSVAANIVFDLALIPSLGVRGACLGTIAAEWIYFPLSLAVIQRTLGISSIWQVVGKPLVAGVGMWAVIWMAGPDRPVLSSVAGLAVFLALFVGLRALPSESVRALREALAERPPADVLSPDLAEGASDSDG